MASSVKPATTEFVFRPMSWKAKEVAGALGRKTDFQTARSTYLLWVLT